MSWSTVLLGQVCEKITDGTHHSPANFSEGRFKYITAKNIRPWGLDLADVTYVDEPTHREIYSRCDVKKDDVLLIKDGATTGIAAINPLDEEFSLLSSVGVLRPGPSLRPKFLLYALQEPTIRARMLDDMAGVAISRLTLTKLKNIEIPLAPIPLQDRIVAKLEELLSDLDTGVAELKAAQAKLGQYRQSLLKAAVDGSLTAEWRKKNKPKESGAQLLDRILAERRKRWEEKQLDKFRQQGKTPPKGWDNAYPQPMKPDTKDLPELPEGWVRATVDQVGDVQLGRQKSPSKMSGLYSTKYIRAANITERGIDFEDILEMDFSERERVTFTLKAGDVLLTEASGSPEHVGRPVIWPIVEGQFCFQNTVLRFTPQVIGSDFAFRIFHAWQKLGTFRKLSGGVGINHLSAGKFSTLAMPLPPLSEQGACVTALESAISALDEQDSAIQGSLRQADAQRKNILKAAFSGQLVPQDPNDEPASVLLERIRAERATGGVKGAKRGRKMAVG